LDFTLLKIRLLQLIREIKLLGVLYSILISLTLILFIFRVYKFYQRDNLALYTVAGIIATVFSLQLSRQDKSFVFLHIENPRQSIFSEYVMLTLPVTIPVLLSPYPYYFIIIIAGFYLISGVKYSPKKKTRLASLGRLISPKNFEWISGIRHSRYTVGLFYITILLISYVMILPVLCLWILTMILFSFYRECEPLNILQVKFLKPSLFLNSKILRHTLLLILIYFPVLTINSVFNPHFIFFNVVFLLVQISVLALTILFKYKMYTPREMLPGNNFILIIIQATTILPFFTGGIPFLLPLPFFMCFKYYSSAKENLNYYLYD
jgi:hypothetical protein